MSLEHEYQITTTQTTALGDVNLHSDHQLFGECVCVWINGVRIITEMEHSESYKSDS